MSNIVQFPTGNTLETRVQRCKNDAVEVLEKYLEQAKEGKIEGVALAYTRGGGVIGGSHSQCENAGELMGSVSLLLHRLCGDGEENGWGDDLPPDDAA